jgi:hypothetical protein
MTDLEKVLERLVTDAEFRRLLATDSARALDGYTLTADQRHMLLVRISPDAAVESTVEQRTSKAGMFTFLDDVTHLLGSGGAPSTGPTTSIPSDLDMGELPGGHVDVSAAGSGPATDIGPAMPMTLHGFDPQPDPPGVAYFDDIPGPQPEDPSYGVPDTTPEVGPTSQAEANDFVIHYAETDGAAPDEAEVKAAELKAPIDEIADIKQHPSDDMLRPAAEPEFPVR